MSNVNELGPDAPVVVNKKGGKQSKTAGRFDLIPGKAMIRIAQVAEYGATRYERNNWRLIAYESHINHAIQHLAALLCDDRSDDHLGHALTRLAFAVEVEDPDYSFTELPGETLTVDKLMYAGINSHHISTKKINIPDHLKPGSDNPSGLTCGRCGKPLSDCVCVPLTLPYKIDVETLRENCLHGYGTIERDGRFYCRLCGAEMRP